ncbi:hypothetical protein [Alloactinosynnema sp. L-07]|uniref:hypothetical protein n=1 Tax=Alloactinosynnema sp. L-07 TaxID=1653480 RepID=UPI00065EF0D7|nr:hypothetical protein [Alloactinosynnema sp. L-07]CRK57063.1 hypothetical protein [Alloactinosynnema sp. L-07]
MRSDGEVGTEGWEAPLVDIDHGIREHSKPVWVRLGLLYIRGPGKPRHLNPAGIVLAGEVPGLLSAWKPIDSGEFMGRVTYPVDHIDGRAPIWLQDQWIPDYAIRTRTEKPGEDALRAWHARR